MSRNSSQVIKPRVLLDGLAMPESPRWHDGRLWFSNWGADEIVAVDLDGNSEVVDPAQRARLGGQLAPGRPNADHRGRADPRRA